MAVIVVGADIGQKRDPTAFVVCEYEVVTVSQAGEPIDLHGLRDYFAEAIGWQEPPILDTRYVVRMMHRMELNTPYPKVARRLNALCKTLKERDASHEFYLVVDATGVGAPVVDILRDEIADDVHLSAVTLTGGEKCDSSPLQRNEVRMSKTWMVSRLQAILQTRRLTMPKNEQSAQLAKELLDFEIKVSRDGSDTFGAFKVGTHDDLVTALGLSTMGEAHTQVTYGPDIWR